MDYKSRALTARPCCLPQAKNQSLNQSVYIVRYRTTVINGAHSSITHMMIKSAGKIIYDTDNLHNVTYVKNLLCKLIFCVNSKLYNI